MSPLPRRRPPPRNRNLVTPIATLMRARSPLPRRRLLRSRNQVTLIAIHLRRRNPFARTPRCPTSKRKRRPRKRLLLPLHQTPRTLKRPNFSSNLFHTMLMRTL